MSFDDRLRQSLDAAARSFNPSQPPLAAVQNRAHHRRRTVLYAGAGGCAVTLVVVLALLLAAGGGRPNTRLATAGSTGAPRSDEPPGAGAGAVDATSTTARTGGATASTVHVSGTAVAPPAVIHPGSSTTIRPGTTTTPTSNGADVVVTQADNGKTVSLQRGQRLRVSLSESGWDYSEPATDNATVLPRVDSHADPSTGAATGTFTGAAAGQAHVSSSKDAPCRKSTPPCMVPSYLFEVTVNVA
jgi:hypothetical protein